MEIDKDCNIDQIKTMSFSALCLIVAALVKASYSSALKYAYILVLILMSSIFFVSNCCANENRVRNACDSHLFSGSYNYEYKIDLPSGMYRKSPLFLVSYSSYLTINKPFWASAGWDVPTSYVQSKIDGTFSLFLNGAKHDLVAAAGRYHTLIETHLKIEKKSGVLNEKRVYWTVIDANGTEYRFGSTLDSENMNSTSNASATPRVWRWSLDRIKDTNGNCIFYSYTEDRGAVYPSRIEYNNDRKRMVEFILEDRTDPYWTVEQGSEIYVAKRLSKINITVSGNPVKSFTLDYALSTTQTPKSLLTSITKYGVNGSPLSPTKFSYKPLDASFSNYSSLHSQSVPGFRQVDTTNTTTADTYDINGDGLPDHVDSSVTPWKVSLGTGSGFMAPMDWAGAPAGPITETDSAQNVKRDLIDINGDGLPDVVIAKADGTWDVYLNNGNGFAAPVSWSVPDSVGFIRTVSEDPARPGSYIVTRDLLDMNGDGVVDLVSKGANGWQVAVNKSGQAWLLEKITEDLGGTTTVTYASSATYPNNQLPSNYWVVSAIARDNGMTGPHHTSSTTGFSYENGLYSGEFRGFGQVTESKGDGSKVIHTFHQDDALKGKEAQTRITDAGGNPYAATVNSWSAAIADGVYNVTLDRVEELTYDGMPTNPKQVVTDYQYDPYGNIILESRYGDTSVNGDELYTFREYVYNPDSWIVDKIKHAYSSEAIGGPRLRESWFSYDNHTDMNTPPEKGNLTREEHFLNTGANPVTSYEYDTYGNRTKSTDPEGRSTLIKFDDLFHTFPVEVTNAKGQTTVREFNSANGQPTQEKDANGFITRYTYDTFNRPDQVIKPGDSDTFPTTRIRYSLSGAPPSFVTVSRRVQSGANATLDSFQFVDGFGKLIQTKAPYKNSSNLVAQDVYYDAMGRDFKHSNQYLADPSAGYTVPLIVPSTITEYDTLGRPTKTTNPDTTFSSATYDHWAITATDENGHGKVRLYDANKNLLQVVEKNHVGANGGAITSIDESYTTNYFYNPLSELLQTQNNYGNTVTYWYDSLGRKVMAMDPDQGRKDFVYDLTGNLVQQTDGRGIITKFTYDQLNRTLRVLYPKDTGILYTYDLNTIGVLSQVTDSLGTVAYKYDNRLRRVQEDRTMDSMTWTTKWFYDDLDRITNQLYPDGNTVSFSYNSMGKLGGISSILNNIDYNERGQEINRTYFNGLSTGFDYSATTQRLKKITTAAVQDFSYDYDLVGNVKSIANAGDAANKRTETFLYDDLDRLVNAEDPGTNGYKNTYTYNAIGNMLAETDVKNGVTSVAQYTYGLGGAGPHAVTGKSDTKPVLGLFSLNNGKAYSTTQSVTLNNIAMGYPTEYIASEKADFSDASWKPYSTAPVFVLSAGYVRKTVYFKARNSNGETAVKNSDIDYLLDSTGSGTPDIYNPDKDKDGIPDAWELAHGIDQNVPGHALLDPDHDGLNNLQEYLHSTNPNKADSDDDGWSDTEEITNGTNPNSNGIDNVHDGISENYSMRLGRFNQGSGDNSTTKRASSSYTVMDTLGTAISVNALTDTDGDGIPDIIDPDKDNDGIPDAWEKANGINQTVPGHAQLDPDHDGLTNLQEYRHGTNPNAADTDHDGLSDYAEVYVYHTDPNVLTTNQPAVSESYSMATSGFTMGGGNRVGTSVTLIDIVGTQFNKLVLKSNMNVTVTPQLLDYGVVASNGLFSIVTVANLGSTTITIGTITVDGENSFEFTAPVQNDTCSKKSIPPSGSCTIGVWLMPVFSGAKAALLHIPTNDAFTPSLTVNLSGIAANAINDQTPPTGGSIIINNGAAITSSRQVNLTLSAQDASIVAGMCISNSNVCSDWVMFNRNVQWSLPEADGAYSVYVWFRDGVGNANVSPYKAVITLDTVPPIVSASVKGGLYNAAQPIALTSNKAGTIYYSSDGKNPLISSMRYGGPLTFTANTELKFFAVDSAGNQSIMGSEVYTIDTISPSLVINYPANGTFTNKPSLNISGKISDNSVLESLKVNAVDVVRKYDNTFSQPVTLTLGVNLFTTVATDRAGNRTTDTRSVVYDVTPPPVTITGTPSNPSNKKNGSFTFNSTDTTATFECILDSGDYTVCSSPFTFAGLNDGSHTFTVRSKDPAANVTPVPASYTWEIKSTYHSLDVLFKGSGTGSVHSVPVGISCINNPCGYIFSPTTTAILTATASTDSKFSGWAGACTNLIGGCSLSIDLDRNVTATFTLAQAVRLLTAPPVYFDSIQAAFSAATGNVTIQGRGAVLTEDLTLSKAYVYTFKGGFDGGFSSQSGVTMIQGKLTVGKGSMVVDRLIVR